MLSKYLQYLIKIKSICTWRVCEPPNTHCSQANIEVFVKIGFINLAPFKITLDVIGPASFLINTNWLNKNNYATFHIISLGNMKQIMYVKSYSEPSLLCWLIGMSMPFLANIFVSTVLTSSYFVNIKMFLIKYS